MRRGVVNCVLCAVVLCFVMAGCRPSAHGPPDQPPMVAGVPPEIEATVEPEEAALQPPVRPETLGPEQDGYTLDTEWQERVGALDWASGAVALAAAADGTLYVQSFGGNYIRKISPNGEQLDEWRYDGYPSEGCDWCELGCGIAVDPAGERVYALTHMGDVQVFSAGGRLLDTWDYLTSEGASGIAAGEHVVYVATQGRTFEGLRLFFTNGEGYSLWSEGYGPDFRCSSVALAADGDVYVVGRPSSGRKAIRKYDWDGTLIAEWGEVGSGPGEFENPWDIAVDEAGNLFVAEHWPNNRIQKLSPGGEVIAVWRMPDDPDSGPDSIDVDGQGNVYVASFANPPVKFRPLDD